MSYNEEVYKYKVNDHNRKQQQYWTRQTIVKRQRSAIAETLSTSNDWIMIFF